MFLGVFIDGKLNFHIHIKYVIIKIAHNTGIFYKIRDYLPMKVKLYYYSLIYSYLINNVEVWGGTYYCLSP